jgi:hypothetical protein
MGKLTNCALLLCLFALPAFAQGEGEPKPVATLQVDKGVVMTSTGGEYLTGASGQQLIADERVMVTQGSSATIVYSEHCKRTFDTPGVYTVDPDCKKAVAWFNGTTAAIGAAVVAGVIIANRGHHKPPPISR